MSLPENRVQLGAFEVFERIGRGGMGSVMQGRHRATGVPVAVKLVRPDSAWGEAARRMFRAEVRAVASLDHPGVVMVLDHGEVDEGIAPAAGVAPGTPYLVMELCSGGTLSRFRGMLGWPAVRPMLLRLLDALAHAHARGVIHRDIKPANVLLAGPLDLRPGIKLTDFGIAQVGGGGEATRGEGWFAGSPAYAPPEQLAGRESEIGPWTDLYGIGCLAWSVMCGAPPHADLEFRAIAAARLEGRMPPFEPIDPTPPEFVAWLHRMLARRPGDRFAHAADAAWALRSLAPLSDEERDGGLFDLDSLPRAWTATASATLEESVTAAATRAAAPTRLDTVALRLDDLDEDPAAPAAPPGVRPPLPDDWRPPRSDRPATRLVGAGLGLFAFRSVRLVGRQSERDRVWATLQRVVATGTAAAIVVRGPSGVGKSRLVQWIAQRAAELGVAEVLSARHSPDRSAQDGLGPMLRRAVRLPEDPGARPDRVVRALRRWGIDDPWLQAAGAELITPGSTRSHADLERVDLGVSGRRYEALLALLGARAARRPLILCLDDVQWGADALGFLLRLVRGALVDRLPVLALVTVRDPALRSGSAEEGALTAVLESPGVEAMHLSALEGDDQDGLVGGLLDLEPPLRAEVVRRTGGNPLFAVQLLGDWVRRGVLEAGPDGFRRVARAEAGIPDDIHALWTARLDDALASGPPASRFALDVAGAIGSAVSPGEWSDAVGFDVAARRGPLPLLVDAGLMAFDADGTLRFVHGMARESVERRAREEGTWEAAQACCALALAGRGDPAAVERRGRHRLAAGDAEDALPDLRAASARRRDRGDPGVAEELLTLYFDALDQAGVGALDPRRLRARLDRIELDRRAGDDPRRRELRLLIDDIRAAREAALESRALSELGRRLRDSGAIAEAAGVLRSALDLAEEADASEELAIASRSLGWVRSLQGEHAAAITLFRWSAEVHAGLGDLGGTAVAYMGLSEVYLKLRDLDQAELFGRRAEETARSLGDARRAGDACVHLARAALERGRLDEAEGLLRRALTAQRRAGAQAVLLSTLNMLGEVERKRGAFDAAEAAYRDALAQSRAYAPAWAWLPRLNLAALAMESGKFADARAPLEAARDQLAEAGRRPLVECADILLLPSLLGAEAYGAFDACLARVEAAAPRWKRLEEECLAALRWAAPMAARAGHGDAERRLERLAEQYAERLADGPRRGL